MTNLNTSPRIRFNWGYWDGRSDRDNNRRAMWEKTAVYETHHPLDAIYGQGYWAGRRDTESPETSDVAWAVRPKLSGPNKPMKWSR